MPSIENPTRGGFIREGADATADVTEEADVCVIGSGCGGASLASRLQQRGRRVVILEQGAYHLSQRGDFNMREVDMYHRLYAGGGATGPEDLTSSILWGETVGGSSVHYMANSFRTPDRKLALWAERFGVAGMSPPEMAPYFAEVEAVHGVHDATDDEMNENNRLFRKGTVALGWSGQPTRHARRQCTGQGVCMLGCPLDRKQSQLLTNLPAAVAAGAHLYADCRADRIVTERRGGRERAVGVEATIHDGSSQKRAKVKLTVRAKVVVLAAGGVGTPVILLRQNLANSSGQVGKNFQVTPHFFLVGDFDHRVESYYGLPTSWVLHQFEEVRGDEGGYMIQGIFAQAGMIATLLPGFGAAHRALMRRIPHFAALLSLLDDEEPGQVTLHETGRAKVDYHVRGRDVPKARDFFRKAARILLAAGAKRVLIPDKRKTEVSTEADLRKIETLDFTPGNIPFVGTSNLGTCRMGQDPAHSVVDSTGKTHDVDNLYIVDASVLPTATAVDPSVTIMANSLRVADGMLARWDELAKS